MTNIGKKEGERLENVKGKEKVCGGKKRGRRGSYLPSSSCFRYMDYVQEKGKICRNFVEIGRNWKTLGEIG